MKQRAIPPFRGASNNSSFFDANSPFAPPDALENVVVFDATKDRPRMGSRWGLAEYAPGTFGNGRPIQGEGVVSRGKTATGYTLGDGTDIAGDDGGAHTQPVVAGNVFARDTSWGLYGYRYNDVTAAGPFADTGVNTQPNRSVSAVARSPDGTRVLVGQTYVDGSGITVARVTCLNAETMAVVWSKKLSDVGIARFVNAIACNAEWVFVCTNHFLRVYKLSDGSNPATGASVFGFNGWADEAIDCAVSADGTTLFGVFLGTSDGATLLSGVVVTAGIYAQHFRSGVMKFTIATVAGLAAAGQVLTQVALSPQLLLADTYYEGPNPYQPHNYCRFSEQLPWKPRGLLPTGIALRPGGGFVVIHANAAWGPNGTPGNTHYRAPDGSADYWNVSAFSAAGVFQWRADCDSIISEDGGAGFFNDLLDPTLKAIDINADGLIAVGGRRTLASADGTNVFLITDAGDFSWDSNLGTTVREGCIAFMPMSGSIAVGGDRSNTYPGAGAVNAQLWELRLLDGAIIRHADLGNVSTLGLVGRSDDALFQVTDKV